jgi:hypothetical protein
MRVERRPPGGGDGGVDAMAITAVGAPHPIGRAGGVDQGQVWCWSTLQRVVDEKSADASSESFSVFGCVGLEVAVQDERGETVGQ